MSHPGASVRIRAARALLLPALLLAACADPGDGGNGTADGGRDTVSEQAGPAGNAVEMSLIAFRPEAITVAAGDEVTWTQNDAGFHTVTSGTVEPSPGGVTPQPDGLFDSGELPTDETFSRTFDEPGTYAYFCEIHPATMTGEVVVENA